MIQTRTEELYNGMTHLFSFMVGIVIFSLLLIKSNNFIPHLIYSLSVSFVFLISTLYHFTRKVELKKVYRLFDYIAIHYAIAGTFTALMMHIGTSIAYYFLIFQWTVVLIGTVEKVKFEFKFRKFSLIIFLFQGWSFLFIIDDIAKHIDPGFLNLIIAGGIVFNIGVVFYLLDKIENFHAVFHVFAFAGFILHYFGIYFYTI